jgi:hypothetical protein
LTLGPPLPKTAIMNRSAALITVGFAGAIIGAVIAYFVFRANPLVDPGPAKYVVVFGDTNASGSKLVTADLDALRKALTSPAPTPNWTENLQEAPSEGAPLTPISIPTQPAPGGTLLMARVQVVQQGQNNGPCTMHVTQKVGLNDPTQVRNVLAALNPSATPVPK